MYSSINHHNAHSFSRHLITGLILFCRSRLIQKHWKWFELRWFSNSAEVRSAVIATALYFTGDPSSPVLYLDCTCLTIPQRHLMIYLGQSDMLTLWCLSIVVLSSVLNIIMLAFSCSSILCNFFLFLIMLVLVYLYYCMLHWLTSHFGHSTIYWTTIDYDNVHHHSSFNNHPQWQKPGVFTK
jgi:hypothetical protein